LSVHLLCSDTAAVVLELLAYIALLDGDALPWLKVVYDEAAS
jgi:hypothetical protein